MKEMTEYFDSEPGLYSDPDCFVPWKTLLLLGKVNLSADGSIIERADRKLCGVIVMPETVSEIGAECFAGGDLPEENGSCLEGAVMLCGDAVTVGASAFERRKLLEFFLTVPECEGVTVKKNAFSYAGSETKTGMIFCLQNLLHAEETAFVSSGITGISSGTDLRRLKTAGYCAFGNCAKLKGTLLLNGADIRENAFSGCNGITSADIAGCTLGANAFGNCGSLYDAKIRNCSGKVAGEKAQTDRLFSGCDPLTELTADIASAECFGKCCFERTRLTSVNALCTEQDWEAALPEMNREWSEGTRWLREIKFLH